MDALVLAMRHNAFDQGIDSFIHSIFNEIPIHHDPVKAWTMLQVFHGAVESRGRAFPMDLVLLRSGSLDVRSVCHGASSIRERAHEAILTASYLTIMLGLYYGLCFYYDAAIAGSIIQKAVVA